MFFSKKNKLSFELEEKQNFKIKILEGNKIIHYYIAKDFDWLDDNYNLLGIVLATGDEFEIRLSRTNTVIIAEEGCDV